MPPSSSQHVSRFYESYRDTEVTFNSQVIIASGLLTSEVQLNVAHLHIPCVLYACSMKGARVIAEINTQAAEALSGSGSLALLRLAFQSDPREAPTSFFVSARVESLTEYHPEKPHVQFVTLEFTQKPSDVLIEILGSFLEISSNALRRRDERIVLTPESMKRIGLISKESCVAIGGEARRCIVRDLSFGGAKILMSTFGTPQAEKKVLLKLAKCELKDDTVLDGAIVRVEDVQGRNDLVALSIKFSTEPPISYKQRINSFFAAELDTEEIFPSVTTAAALRLPVSHGGLEVPRVRAVHGAERLHALQLGNRFYGLTSLLVVYVDPFPIHHRSAVIHIQDVAHYEVTTINEKRHGPGCMARGSDALYRPLPHFDLLTVGQCFVGLGEWPIVQKAEMPRRCPVDHRHLVNGKIDRCLWKSLQPAHVVPVGMGQKSAGDAGRIETKLLETLERAAAHHARVKGDKLVACLEHVHGDKAKAHHVESVDNLARGRNWISHTV